jgi:hypothetical protein
LAFCESRAFATGGGVSTLDLFGHIWIGVMTLLLAVAPGPVRMGHIHHRKGDPLWTLAPWESLILRVVLFATAVVAWWEVWAANR